jgi:predicted lipoprotein with Yx(FWY)xxD motif
VKRPYILLTGVVLAGAVSASAVASAADGVPAARASRVAKVQLRHTSLGKILVDASGFTLYRFTRDTHNTNTCVKVSQCPSAWPALSTSANPVAGSGVKASLLSTIKLPGGARQVTYAGHPLYRYALASERAETFYVGAMQFGGTWYAVNAAGNTVK